MKALDLFCGAGGVARGLQYAGFHVTGVDIEPQPRYAGDRFVQADALASGLDLTAFDFIWASPPCQFATSLRTMHNAKKHENMIPTTRALLRASGVPYVIENVVGASVHLETPFMLCGSMFGLATSDGAELRRHRLFEASFPVLVPTCQHGSVDIVGIYGGHARNRRRTIGVYGEGCRDSRRKYDKGFPDFSIDDGRVAMGISWMTTGEISQAIPPAYAEFIARAFMSACRQSLDAALTG